MANFESAEQNHAHIVAQVITNKFAMISKGVIQMKRKLTVFVLCFSLIASCCMIGSSAKYFTDVSSTSEYLDAINYVSDNGYMGGTSSTEFSPTGNMNRAMFVTVLYRYSGSPSVTGTEPFTDVTATAWYYDAVCWAYNEGYIDGTSATAFSPTANITRQDAATVLYRYAGMPECDGSVLMGLWITDCSDVPDYAQSAILWAAAEKVMSLNVRRFRPASILSRQEMAEAIVNYGVYVKGIELGLESFNFSNQEKDFFDEGEVVKFNISSSHLATLRSILCSDEENTEDLQAFSRILDEMSTIKDYDEDGKVDCYVWPGACFGMAVTTALDKIGKIDFNTNFSATQNIHSVDLPKNNDGVESAICYYHMLQFVPSIVHTQYGISDVQTLVDIACDDRMFVLGLSNYLEGHAVLVYDIEQINEDKYRLVAWDPKYPNTVTHFIADVSYGSFYYENNEINDYYNFTVYKTWDGFDRFDLDGTYNTGSYGQPVLNSKTDSVQYSINSTNEYDTLYFSSNSNIIIINDAGEVLEYSDGEITGDMTVLAKYNCYSAVSGHEYIVYVPNSSSYTYEFDSSCNTSFRVSTKDKYVSFIARGEGIVKCFDDKVDIEGKIETYCVTMQGDDWGLLNRVSGFNEEKITIQNDGVRLVVEGTMNDAVYANCSFTGETN